MTSRRITARQLRFLNLAAAGLTMDEIAAKVYMSTWSVKNDLTCAREALGATNTAHAVAVAVRAGLIPGAGGPLPRRHPRTGMFRRTPTGTGWPT